MLSLVCIGQVEDIVPPDPGMLFIYLSVDFICFTKWEEDEENQKGLRFKSIIVNDTAIAIYNYPLQDDKCEECP